MDVIFLFLFIIIIIWLIVAAVVPPPSDKGQTNPNSNKSNQASPTFSNNQQNAGKSVAVKWNSNQTTYSSSGNRDFSKLEELLRNQEWQEANQETNRQLLQILNKEDSFEVWEEDIKRMPSWDILTIDNLWVKYSNGRFGFSVQKRIWLECGGNPKKPEDVIGWEGWAKKVNWPRSSYSLEAALGNLPNTVKSLNFKVVHLLARSDVPSSNGTPSSLEINRMAHLTELRRYHICGYGSDLIVTYLGKRKDNLSSFVYQFRNEDTGECFEINGNSANSINLTPL